MLGAGEIDAADEALAGIHALEVLRGAVVEGFGEAKISANECVDLKQCL